MSSNILKTTPSGNIKSVKLSPNQGFGLDTSSELESKKKFGIRVSDQVDYLFSFWFKQTLLQASFTFSVDCYDEMYNKVETIDIFTAQNNSFFIDGTKQIIMNEKTYHYAKCILYSSLTSTNLVDQPITTIPGTTNLIMRKGTVTVFPRIKCISSDVILWGFKMRPLRTPFSTCFLDNANLLEIWRKNNRNNVQDEDIDRNAKDYLLPYNTLQTTIKL